MEMDFAFLADSAEVTNGKLYVISGAIDTIWATKLPHIRPHLSLVMKLQFSPAEIAVVHKLEILLMDEDGKRLATVGGDLNITKNPNLPKGWKQGFITVLNFWNLKFEKFGDYSFEVVINSSSIKSLVLRVVQRVALQT